MVTTVTDLLVISPVRLSYLVAKLCVLPAPTLVKKIVLAVLPTPMNPSVPSPTLTVAIPIRSSEIFATNKVCPSVKVFATPIEPLSLYWIAVPPFEEYVRLSPVFKLCPLIKTDLVGIKIWVEPAPGLPKVIVVPEPTSVAVPSPSASTGVK